MITVIGSINLDLTANASRLPVPGETVGGSDFATAAGGKGANQAVAVLRAGAPMRMVGAVGDDAFAAGALAELTRDGADLSGVRKLTGASGIAVILVGGDGENMIVVVPGANALVDETMARTAVAALQKGDVIVLQQEIPAATNAAALDAARAAGVTSVFNTAPFTKDSASLSEKADIVVANETEFALLIGREVAGKALTDAVISLAKAKSQTIIVTLGGDGAVAATKSGELLLAAAPRITPVDTVGAGDTFCGYLAAALGAGDNLQTALERAAMAGALACLKPGAQPAIPYASEVDAALSRGSR